MAKEKIDFRPLSEEEIAGIDVIEHETSAKKYRGRRKKR